MNIKAYSKRVTKGLYRLIIIRAWPVWATPLVIYLALIAPYLFKYFGALFWTPEFHLRLAGFILQGLFVLIVACDIRALNKEFDRPTIFESIVQWGEDFINVFFPKPVTINFSESVNTSDSVSVSKRPSLGQSDKELLERIEILERWLLIFEDEMKEKFQEIKLSINELEKSLNEERQSRKQDIQKFKGFVERISTRGLRLESTALGWLIFGLAFSIFPNELAVILNYL